MAKKVIKVIKLQIPAGQANPAPPVGPALGQHGVNIMDFCKAFNAETQGPNNGQITPVEISVYEDRSFTFITKTPPAAVLIKEALNLQSGSGEPNRTKVGTISRDQLRSIAERKMPDLNANDVEAAMNIVAGTARSMGVEVGALMAGKKYTGARGQVDREKLYAPLDGVRTLKSLDTAKFDETVEVHIRLGVNVRHADQQLRGTLFLPHGLGKSVTVAVFAQGEKAKEAEEAGADVVGGDDLAARITEGWSDFDVAIATPDMMGTVGRLGRILGPQGKMPSPKAGTITFDIGKAVSDVKSGKIEYRTDRTGIVHAALGKKSFEEQALVENYQAVLEEILRVKPSSAKGRYLRSITIASTMSPGIKLDTTRVRDLMEDAAAPAAQAV